LKTGTSNQTTRVELKTDEFTETRRVVVLVGFGVTEGFQQRVELEELLLERTSTSCATSNVGNVLDDLLGVLSLSGTRLTSDEHGLILAVADHHSVSSVGDGEDVRGDFIPSLSAVIVNHGGCVNGNHLVRVDGNAEKSRVGVDQVSLVTLVEIVEDGGFVQVREISTIFDTIELGRIHG
jgi:hypothetical protein